MVSKAHGSLHGKTIHMKWYLKPGKGIDFSLHCESTLSPENSWQTREVVINLYTCKIVIRLPHQRRGFASRIVGDNRISSVQLLSRICFFATPWTAARQASLSITNSQSLLKLMSIELVMPQNHLILCHPLLLLSSIFPSIRVFPMSQFFASGSQSIGVSASASVLPMNIQDWFPLGWTGWIALQSKGLSRVFSNTTVQKHQFFGAQLSLFLFFIYFF